MAEVRPLTDEEQAWVVRMVDAATSIAAAYRLAPPPGQPMEPARLDTLWRSWLPDPGFAGQDPMLFLNPFGMALGQWLVDRTGLVWAMATDERGTGVAIRDETGEILVLPVDLVRKGFESRSAAFFVEVAQEIEEQVRSSAESADPADSVPIEAEEDATSPTAEVAPPPDSMPETGLPPDAAEEAAPTPDAAVPAGDPEASPEPVEDAVAAASADEPPVGPPTPESEPRRRTGLARLFGRR